LNYSGTDDVVRYEEVEDFKADPQ